MNLRLAAILALITFSIPSFSGEAKGYTLSEVPSLVKEVVQNQRRLDGRNVTADYVSTVKVLTKRLDGHGKVKSSDTQIYEHYPASPKSIVILTEMNGVPTSQAKLERERGKALKEMERFLAQLGNKPIVELENSPGFRISLGVYDFLRNSEFYTVEDDLLDGRKMITLKFRPKAGWIDPKGIVHHLSGVLWIDANDKIVARAKAWVTTMTTSAEPFFEMYHKKIYSDVWSLVYFRINPAVKPELFNNERFDWSFENYDFQRFSVDQGQITKVNP
jgi:hypothetical protein